MLGKLLMMPTTYMVVAGVVVLAVVAVISLILPALRVKKAPDHSSEDFYLTANRTQAKFPSVFDPPTLLLSLVIPAYKERVRLPAMMDAMLKYLDERSAQDASFTWEIIIVDDGSKTVRKRPDEPLDQTAEFVQDTYVAARGADKIRLLVLHKNNGKGGAVRKGMVRTRGKYILMVDADGATRASDLGRLLTEIQRVEKHGLGIAVGSRAHLEEAEAGVTARRTALRRFLMWGFHTFITLMLGGTDIKDTQCGFKLFTRRAAQLLFPIQHIDRWAFDVELLYLAGHFGIPVTEVPVEWMEIEGSKVEGIWPMVQMARDVFAIRLCYLISLWSQTPDSRVPMMYEETQLSGTRGTTTGGGGAGTGAESGSESSSSKALSRNRSTKQVK